MVKKKHRIKRIYSAISFGAILFTLVFVLVASIIGSENTASVLSSASGIIVMILGCLTSIVLAYLGLAYHDDLKTGDQDSNQ